MPRHDCLNKRNLSYCGNSHFLERESPPLSRRPSFYSLVTAESSFFVTVVLRKKFAGGDKVTTFGKEYLCNACLSREPTAVTELHVSSATSDEDDVTARKYRAKYNSVSAPATPAKQNLSVTATTTMITDADGSLDMSTRSLLDAHTADGMYVVYIYCSA